jgi:hypothetical protein
MADGFNLSQIEEMVNETTFGAEFYKQAVMSNDTFAFAARHGEVLTNAKMDEYKLPELESTATLQNSDCGQNSVDETTFKQADLKMVGIKIEGEFCPQKLEPYFLAMQLPAGQHYENFNPLQARIVERVGQKISEKMGIFPWQGPTGTDTLTYTTSWLDQLRAATGIVVGTSTITSGGSAGTDAAGAFNVVEALIAKFLANAYAAGEVFQDGSLAVAMSPKVVNLYFQNYRKLFGGDTIVPSMQILADGRLTGWYHPGTRVEIVVQNALGISGDVVITRKSNLVLAFDLASDSTRLDLWYDKTDDLIYWRLKTKMGTGIHSITNPNVAKPNILYWGAAS